ncbi:TnpV protein [Chakrabartyella piscis]|uniref:TnpV protein n=1 Tax=Chakrabartyella piscis TaxID=2918914 RepID=UPI002958439C|nr:TnpV protein [Chakrabartyella piscis]
MNLTYSKNGDYFIPNIKLDNENYKQLGKYGRMRKAWLMEQHSPLFNHLLLSEKLVPHLNEIDKQAQHLLDTMIPTLKAEQGVTDELKMSNQLEWVGRMNNIMAQVEEVIFSDIVYA